MIAASAADLGSMLREARKAKKMSQTELAAMVGVSRQWVISAEKGAPTARVDLMLDALWYPGEDAQRGPYLVGSLGGQQWRVSATGTNPSATPAAPKNIKRP